MGFIRRNKLPENQSKLEYKWYPAVKGINRLSTEIRQDMLWTGDLGLTDYSTELNFSARLSNAMFLRAAYEQNYVKLLSDFDPTRTDGVELKKGQNIPFGPFLSFISPIIVSR